MITDHDHSYMNTSCCTLSLCTPTVQNVARISGSGRCSRARESVENREPLESDKCGHVESAYEKYTRIIRIVYVEKGRVLSSLSLSSSHSQLIFSTLVHVTCTVDLVS